MQISKQTLHQAADIGLITPQQADDLWDFLGEHRLDRDHRFAGAAALSDRLYLAAAFGGAFLPQHGSGSYPVLS